MAHEFILAIDDQQAVLEVLEALLTQEGYVVHTVSDPQEALQLYRQRWSQTALVLIDYRLPGMLGDELFTRLQSINPEVRALLVTSHCPDSVGQLLDAGLRGVVLKPFHIDTLLQAVQRALAGPPPSVP